MRAGRLLFTFAGTARRHVVELCNEHQMHRFFFLSGLTDSGLMG
ncbi:hypothetical protein C4K35_4656 [Pseudomonas chlororaphis subsp. piscium]|nr:hypothetical protein C4K35_4656 [Pseudomonas chlororaphis subsp. piscium]